MNSTFLQSDVATHPSVRNILRNLNRNGYSIDEIEDNYFKSGTVADVFKIKNKILKFLSEDIDGAEFHAENYQKLVGKKLKYVGNVYYFDVISSSINDDLYVIVQDYIPHESEYEEVFEDTSLNSDVFYHLMKKFIAGYDKPNINEFIKSGTIKKGSKNKRLASKMINQVWRGFKELEKYNVNFQDVHEENVRKNDAGNYIIIDF